MEIFPFAVPESDRKGLLLSFDEGEAFSKAPPVLHSIHRNIAIGSSLIVVRPFVSIQRPAAFTSMEEPALRELAIRFPEASIALLCSENYVHELSSDLFGRADDALNTDEKRREMIASIRQQELLHFVTDSNAILPRSRSYRYRLPSGVIAPTFVRVGNIQTSRHTLDAVFFWMLPHLRRPQGMLVETWSIGSIALNVARQIAKYDASKPGFRVDMLAHYHDGRPGTRAEFATIARGVSQNFDEPFLIVYSASMSGKSLRHLARSLASAHCPPENVERLVLYHVGAQPLADPNISLLCRLKSEAPSAAGNAQAANKVSIVDIDENTYFPRVLRDKQLRLTRKVAAQNKKFFDRYRSSNAIRVHVNTYLGEQIIRHHGIDIDVYEMLKVHDFLAELETKVLSLEPVPAIIIVPPHAAGEALASKIADIIEKKATRPEVYVSVDLQEHLPEDGKPKTDLAKRLHGTGNNDAVLLIDDVITTGSRIRSLQRSLRHLFRGRIHYFVGVARMESSQAWRDLQSTLRLNEHGDAHSVTAVEVVTLPDWNTNDCPWCEESRIFDEIIEQNPNAVSKAMKERALLLRSADKTGLINNVFLEGIGIPTMILGPNSAFVKDPAQPATVAAAVASAIQELRSESDEFLRLAPDGFPVRNILAFADLDRYTDPILRSAILRASRSSELRRSKEGDEKKRAMWTQERLKDPEVPDRQMRREILTAVLTGKLPPHSLDQNTLLALRNEGFSEFCDLVEKDLL
jgi:hypothetical protein